MHLKCFFPTVKPADLYRFPVKRYPKNTHGSSILKWILGMLYHYYLFLNNGYQNHLLVKMTSLLPVCRLLFCAFDITAIGHLKSSKLF